MHIVNNPSLPYWGHIPDGVHPGTVIQVDGHIPHHCHKFEINLMSGNDVGHHAEKHSNIALQIRPKIHSKKVILNSRHFGSWGHKEKHRNFHHVHHGAQFNMQIIVEHQHYRVVINGHEICLFHHRVPYHEVRVLYIEGHLDVHRIEFRNQYGAVPTAPLYPSAPPTYGTPYPTRPIYPTPPTVYPAPPPPIYVAPPVVQPAYVPQTIVVEDHHHHGHHGIGHHIADAIFGHDHHHHGHHDHHHHGHHGHHDHHGHHW